MVVVRGAQEGGRWIEPAAIFPQKLDPQVFSQLRGGRAEGMTSLGKAICLEKADGLWKETERAEVNERVSRTHKLEFQVHFPRCQKSLSLELFAKLLRCAFYPFHPIP